MSTLLDTNVLTRSAQPRHPMCQVAVDAVAFLHAQGDPLCLVPQVLYEFWVVATRPVAENGLGLGVSGARVELDRLKELFDVLPDTPRIFPEWERLVAQHQVSGKNAHDARLVAAMHTHGVRQLLTFNVEDFRRYGGIDVLSPHELLP
jgi:predicted nucleic acid-binding protein